MSKSRARRQQVAWEEGRRAGSDQQHVSACPYRDAALEERWKAGHAAGLQERADLEELRKPRTPHQVITARRHLRAILSDLRQQVP